MLIVLLAALGVDLVVIVALSVLVLGRRRWVGRQPGAFKGAIRVSQGQVDGLGPGWRRGYGRWVRGILVWTSRPFFVQNELVLGDAAVPRAAEPGEVTRLGEEPVVVELAVAGASVFVAARAEDRESALGLYGLRSRTAAVDAGRREGELG
jgi:hypothetical protein